MANLVASREETSGERAPAPLANSAPSCSPLETVEELLQWQPCDQDALRSSVPLAPSPRLLHEGPRLLACHDLAGGYHEDRWAQGCQLDAAAAAAASLPAYFLRRWHALDAFVYFSHRLVTIPPVGWVNAAHTHGVPVLGTLITEWEAGAAACRQLFGTAAAAEAAAAQLAAIAAHHGFDGWLVNIENGVDPEHIPHLLHFLRVLTEQMRLVAPSCLHRVIWYDAVTTEGKLVWQNTLNSLNRPFFDACDAIWVNYTWGRSSTPAAVRKEAGPRAADVYMGVDCFGRGTYGGGGFRCDAALRACLAQGLSAALFATAWPFEGDCGPAASPCWLERDALFWSRIERAWERAYSSGGSSGSSSADGAVASGGSSGSSGSSSSACSPCTAQQLPLFSNFSVGAGRAFYQGGHSVGGPWYNLSLQARQPVLRVQLESFTEGSGTNGSHGGGGSSGSSSRTGSPTAGSPGSAGGASWLAWLQGLCSRLHHSLQAWLGWRAAPCPVQAAVVDHVAFSSGSALRVSGSLPPGQQAAVQLFPANVPLPSAGIYVRFVASSARSADCRLALHVAAAGQDAGSGAAAAGKAAGQAASCCGTLELVLSLPEGTAAAAVPQGWSSGPVATATASSCRSAAWHPVQQPGSSNTDASAGQATAADQQAVPEWSVWEYHLPQSSLLAALPLGATAAATAGADEEEAAPPALLLEGVDVLVRSSSQQAEHGCPGLQLYVGELCIEAASPNGECGPVAPASVQQLQCSSLDLADAPAEPPADPGTVAAAEQQLLSAQLTWLPPAGSTLRCCHVWCSFSAGGDSSSGSKERFEPQRLGAACTNSYSIACLPVPSGATAVQFTVQPEACNGQAQPLHQAAHVAANL